MLKTDAFKNLHIAVVVPYIPPTYIGGGETYIYYLTKEQAKLGIKIDLFTTRLPAKTEDWDWSHVNLYQSRNLFKVGNTPVMPSLFSQMMKNDSYDLIHTAVPSGFACDISALVAGIKKKPVVILYHCDVIPSSAAARVYTSILRLYTLKKVDRIISTTRSYAATSAMLKRFTDKVSIVPMGTDLTRFYRNEQYRREIRKRHNLNDSDRIILFIGGLNRQHKFKRVDLLIKAMAQVSRKDGSAALIIVGEGDLKPGLQQLCRELDFSRVVFTGYVSNEDLPKYCNAADLFVLPSLTREEAFGIVLAETASCGVVPICFDIPGPGEVCRNLGGFIVPLSGTGNAEDELARVITAALTADLSERSKISQRNAKKYAWSEIARQTLEIYQELMQK